MYAIIKTGGKQYRVQQGEFLLIERLPDDDGATVTLQPLLYVDGADVVDGDDLAKVTVQARILAHERGPKLRIVKFKPKRGYKRRNGHRQDLTRIEITTLELAAGRGPAAAVAKADSTPEPATAEATDGA
jgi:large subunit ribosomal protein L21